MPRDVEQRSWLSQPASANWRHGLAAVVFVLLAAQGLLVAWIIVRHRKPAEGIERIAGPSFEQEHAVTAVTFAGQEHRRAELPLAGGLADASLEDGAPDSGTDSGVVDGGETAEDAVAETEVAQTEAAETEDQPHAGKTTASPRASLSQSPRRLHRRRASSRAMRRHIAAPPVTAAPTPASARLSVTSDPAAELLIDGSPRGRTPISGFTIAAGQHHVALRGARMQPYDATITLRPGETRTIQVALKPIATSAGPTTKSQSGVAAKQARAATKSKPTPPPTPQPQQPREIPHLPLPASVRVVVYDEGKATNQPRLVCLAVEQAVSRAMGVSVAGTTRALQDYLLTEYAGEDYVRVKLYPRAMGYLLAQSVSRGKRGIGKILREAHRSGRLASLTAAGWKP